MTTSNNYCIILAGGVGCRLWPYSRQQRPKQFLDLFGMGLSMLQITYRRFAKLLPPENIYVSTSAEYVNMVREQLADLPAENVVAEPVQLGTAPATALAAAYINGLHPKANLIISPADQIILREDEFQQQVMQGFRFVEKTPNFLCLGVRAERPETNYGYIQAGEVASEEFGFSSVKSFTEKPSLDFARFFVESGEFYWSTSLFMCSMDTWKTAAAHEFRDMAKISEAMHTGAGREETERRINELFPRNRFQSVDLFILEHHTNVFISPCSFGWRDVGNWDGYYQISQKDGHGNVLLSPKTTLYNCHNNIVMASPGKVVLLSDLDDYLVVENDNIIMLCKKDDAQQIRRMMTDAQLKYGDVVS
ncbi:MAG: mannose-1-phosphate guanylyltransferase [Bacteroidaceae bacterium]|nr:mannose-1-phosphate guanylyltransferase [Bacteroidaceae bacterium]